MNRHDKFIVKKQTDKDAWDIVEAENTPIDDCANGATIATFYEEKYADSYVYWLNGLYTGKFSKLGDIPSIPFHENNGEQWSPKLLTPRSQEGGNKI